MVVEGRGQHQTVAVSLNNRMLVTGHKKK